MWGAWKSVCELEREREGGIEGEKDRVREQECLDQVDSVKVNFGQTWPLEKYVLTRKLMI